MSPKQLCARALSLLSALIILSFAALQLNDPDPYLWVGFYMLCTIAPALGVIGRYPLVINLLVCLSIVLMAAAYSPGFADYQSHHSSESLIQDMSPDKPYIEESREFLGCLIVLVLCLPYLLLAVFKRRRLADPAEAGAKAGI